MDIVAGQRIGRWVVVAPAADIDKRRAFVCRCDCGTERAVVLKSLRRGLSTNCGCVRTKKLLDFRQDAIDERPTNGQRFGRLVLTGLTRRDEKSRLLVETKCDCGATHWAWWHNVKNGKTKSCGCLHRERAAGISRTHGYAPEHRKRGPEYRSWRSMCERCTNPRATSWRYYGGRGIIICPQWRHDFLTFLRDVGTCPGRGYTIDRIDPDGHYVPGNVRWADKQTQARNRRKKAS